MPRKTRGKSAAGEPATPPSGEPRTHASPPLVSVVGIGASAGGLEAFKEMLSALPLDTGMAFVFIVYLPAKHDTVLPEILSRVTSMPICEMKNGMALEANRVYVLPGGSDAGVEDGRLALTARRAAAGQHRPIDHFLESLAESTHQAIAVVLSGSASDGTLGIQQIKAAGGITLAQDDSAEYSSMPRSAIATGAVDFVLRPRDIGREIGRIATHPFVASVPETAQVPSLEPVLEILHESAGVDFRQYKPNTLYRRITRRIVLHKLEGLDDYVRLLKSNAGEAVALYHDILISVTSFFRNPEAFEEIKTEVFPALTQNRSRHDPVRIWTLGCSTGEEAYSLAMAFAEFSESAGRTVPLQVFATDLNAASIERARSGIYAKGSVQEVSDERLRRFFVETDGSYRIAKPIRDACIFARHNVLSDPPFTRIDLVTCRNMLIYLGAELQERVIPVLHHALRPDGYLWLGSSETIGSYRDLFELKHARHKIYARKPVAGQVPLRELGEPRPAGAAPPPMRLHELPSALDGQKEIDRLLVARYAPPSVLIRGDLEIVQYRGNTAPYLAPAPGRPSVNLLKMLREGLMLSVRSALQRAKRDEMPAREDGVRLGDGSGGDRCVNIEVIPVKSGVQRADLFLVLFEEVQAKPPAEPARAAAPGEGVAVQEIARLKQELAATREYLQSIIEQQEGANEELQSANEEVQSANEELQSINEELETSKEEVQSSNEELATVNDELHARNIELARSNNDLLNLLGSVQLAIVMLGANMRIRCFTPMAEKLLNLISTDVGRPMSDIKLNIDVPDMDAMLAAALDTMAAQECEVQDADGRWYLLRVRPYRTMENKIDGAVIVLVDVDSLKRSQEQLRQQTELLNQAHEPILMWELDGDISYWNKAAEETYGFTRDQAICRSPHELLMTTPPYETFRHALHEDRHWSGELVHTRHDGQRIIAESRMVVVTDPGRRELVVEANRPITERKEAESILRRVADDLVTADRNKDEFLAMLAHELRNPLAPLRNVLSVLQSPSVGQAERNRALAIMDRQIHNMARLIDDLLDVSRITLSQIELRKERIDLGALVRRVLESNQSSLDAKNQTVQVDVPDEPIYVEGDAVRLEQLLGNLVQNAWKYTDAGGHIGVALEIEEARRGKALREAVIRVSDTGVGIERDRLSDVFDLFMRATRSIDQRYGGLGIGLTLVRRIAELHGGRVEARSEGAGKGAEFVVRLPAAPATARAADPSSTAQETRRSPTPPRRVLIVDDNADNADSLAMSLRESGHHVETANSGAKALEMVDALGPDVMVLDIGMPDMDGYTLARALKGAAARDGLKLVAVSGYGHAEARERARAAGFDDYLVKPASPGDIDSAFARLFSGT